MPELTQEEIYLYFRTKRRLLLFKILGIVAVAVIVVLFWQGCEGEKNASIAYNKIKDTLQSVLDDTARVQGEARRLRYEKEDIDLKLADAIADRDLWQNNARENGQKAARLAVEVQKAKANKDTPAYYKNCDELAQTNLILEGQLQEAKEAQRVADEFYTASLKLLDSTARHWEDAYNKCVQPVVVAVAELPKIEPKGKMYVDVAAMTGAITAVGGGVTHITKNDKKYTINILGTRYGVAVIGGIGLPIRKRK